MPDTPLTVTIAIPTYRRPAILRQTLEGLVQQDYPAEQLEILIIDNNSRDETRAVVERFAGARHVPRYVLETQQGANFAEAGDDLKVVGFSDHGGREHEPA